MNQSETLAELGRSASAILAGVEGAPSTGQTLSFRNALNATLRLLSKSEAQARQARRIVRVEGLHGPVERSERAAQRLLRAARFGWTPPRTVSLSALEGKVQMLSRRIDDQIVRRAVRAAIADIEEPIGACQPIKVTRGASNEILVDAAIDADENEIDKQWREDAIAGTNGGLKRLGLPGIDGIAICSAQTGWEWEKERDRHEPWALCPLVETPAAHEWPSAHAEQDNDSCEQAAQEAETLATKLDAELVAALWAEDDTTGKPEAATLDHFYGIVWIRPEHEDAPIMHCLATGERTDIDNEIAQGIQAVPRNTTEAERAIAARYGEAYGNAERIVPISNPESGHNEPTAQAATAWMRGYWAGVSQMRRDKRGEGPII